MKTIFLLTLLLSFFRSCFLNNLNLRNISSSTGSGETTSIEIDYSDLVFSTPQSYNLFNYFSNLTINLGDNPSDNCVSVACGMIASYYDTYFNDDIIPEPYDVPSECINNDYDFYYCESSPGIFSQLPTNCLNNDMTINYQVYNQYLNTYDDFVYEVIGVDIYNDKFAPVYHYNTMSPLVSAIDSRLNNVSSSCFSFNIGYGNNIADCKEAIDNGYPVFMRIVNGFVDHAVVAFAYDDNDNFFYHTGYKENNRYGMPMIDNRYQCWAFVVSPAEGFTHVCSNNYYSIDPVTEDISYFCPCMLNGVSYPGHNHNVSHTVEYDFDEDDEIVFDVDHFESCTSCCLSKTIECGVDFITPPSIYQHSMLFDCGCSCVESHYVVDILCVGTDIHEGFCICGSIGYNHHDEILTVVIDDELYYVCICGFIEMDHNAEWKNMIRSFLRDYDYFDSCFFDELEIYLLSLIDD